VLWHALNHIHMDIQGNIFFNKNNERGSLENVVK